MADSSHVKNLENLKKERDFALGWGANYQPSHPDLDPAAMTALILSAEGMLNNVQDNRTPYRNATAACEDGFLLLTPLAQRIRRAAKASGCPQSFLDDLATPIRKILGYRAKPKKKDDPDTPVDESKDSVSASQLDRQSRIEHLDEARSLLESQSLYKPNETDLKTASIKVFSADLQAKVDAISATFVPFANSLDDRDDVFYINATNVYNTGTLFKEYVLAAFGRNSNEWNQVKGLQFRNLKRVK